MILEEKINNGQSVKSENLNCKVFEVPIDKFHVFKKNQHLSINDLQSKSKHIVHNKLSDKLSRRDVHYFDLYALHEPQSCYQQLREDGYPHTKADAKIKELYGDLAFPDFN